MAFTYFFRDRQTLEQLCDIFIATIDGQTSVKIWNPGCASGEEIYTFLIMLAERMNTFAFRKLQFHCTDIDISNQFENIITQGIYPYEKLKRIPENLFQKYFEKKDENHYQINYQLRNRITYKINDLTHLSPIGTGYNLVLCKNVLLHLSPEQRIEVLKMFHKNLVKGGLLAMEQTQELPEQLNHKFQKLTNNSQIYRKI